MARDGGLSKLGVGSRSPTAWSAREIELQALATLAALTPSAAHFLKSHQLLVQKLVADRDRQKIRVSLSSLWASHGYVHGQADQHWLAAEREILAASTAALASKSAPKKKRRSPARSKIARTLALAG